MKAIVIILAALLVFSHPLATAVLICAETAVVAGLGWLTLQGLRAALLPPAWKRTA